MLRILLTFFIFLFIFAPQITLRAQTPLAFTQSNGSGESMRPRYRYLFENERFTTPVQEIELDGNGRGQFRFKRKGGEEIVNKLEVSASVISQIQILFDDLNFLASDEDYQHKKDFSHLGKMTITLAQNGKERTVSFNYTDNQSMNRLRELFSNIAIQETRVFELETVRSTDAISTPAQLRMLESELRGKHIADPQRLVPLLQDIKMDEGVPLIARNHAERLLQMIKKGK
jgi:hypothetical protein